MSVSAMKTKTIYDGVNSIDNQQQTENNGRNNVLFVIGLSDGDKLQFEVSIDGGNTFVVDTSLDFEADGTITLENVAVIIKAKVDAVADDSNLVVLLGC